MKLFLLAAAGVVALSAGCASSGPHAIAGRPAEHVLVGLPYTSPARRGAFTAALLREAAQVTLERGFDHFTVKTAYNGGYLTWAGENVRSWDANGAAYLTPSMHPLSRYGRLAEADILLGRGAPPEDGRSYDARRILALLDAPKPPAP